MPRQVDHDQRRAELAEALWRLASTRGIEAVSLREVAAEAGVSMGRVQHYFASKDDMLAFALELANERAGARIRARLAGDPGPERILREVLTEMLGLNAESRQFLLLGIAFLNRAITSEAIATRMSDGDAELRAFLASLVAAAAGERRGVDPEREARILIQLAAGLGVEVALGQTDPAEAVATVDYYLRRLLG